MTTRTPIRRAILLGGSSDIGVATLERICTADATIALLGRRGPHRRTAAHQLRTTGRTVFEVDYDAAMTYGETKNALLVAQELVSPGNAEPIDAIIMAIGDLGDPDTPDQTLVHNFTGPALLMLAAGELLDTQHGGNLIILSSAAAVRPRTSILTYSISKQAIDSLARTMAPELAQHGVRTLLVRPGHVITKMTVGLPRPPLTSTASQVAERIRKSLDGPRRVIWVPHSMKWVLLGLRLVPRPLIPKSLR